MNIYYTFNNKVCSYHYYYNVSISTIIGKKLEKMAIII